MATRAIQHLFVFMGLAAGQIGCAIPPPILDPAPVELDDPLAIHLSRTTRSSGGHMPWRVNLNGEDIGTLANGTYCTFESADSYLNFSIDEEVSTVVIVGGIGMGLLFPPLGIASVWLKSADRYIPLEPQVRPSDRRSQFLKLEGRPLAVVVSTESDWTTGVKDMTEVACSDPR